MTQVLMSLKRQIAALERQIATLKRKRRSAMKLAQKHRVKEKCRRCKRAEAFSRHVCSKCLHRLVLHYGYPEPSQVLRKGKYVVVPWPSHVYRISDAALDRAKAARIAEGYRQAKEFLARYRVRAAHVSEVKPDAASHPAH